LNLGPRFNLGLFYGRYYTGILGDALFGHGFYGTG
jgi:hypothetical protein